jgi:hypothetical protein
LEFVSLAPTDKIDDLEIKIGTPENPLRRIFHTSFISNPPRSRIYGLYKVSPTLIGRI